MHVTGFKESLTLVGRAALHSSLSEILLIASLILARYLINSDFSYPSEVWLLIMLFGVIGSMLFYLYKWLLKDSLAAHLAALPVVYGLYAYSYTFAWARRIAQALLPAGWETPFTTSVMHFMVLGVVFGGLAFGVGQLVKRVTFLREAPLLKIGVFAVCFIFVVQVGKVGARLWDIRHQLSYKASTQNLQPVHPVALADKPNIYYLIFDRYASAETLSNVYNFDNGSMLQFLTNQGFVTRQEAYANYPFTPQSVSSTLEMSYHGALGQRFNQDARQFQTAFPYRSILNDSLLTQTLHKEGYTYNQVSSWWDFTRNNSTADYEPSRSFRLRLFGISWWLTDLQRDLVNKSILSPWLLKGVTVKQAAVIKYDRDRNPAQNLEAQLTALETIASQSTKQSRPQFTFAHILSPHDPYVFDENGALPQYSSDRTDAGADETVKYTKQLTYVNRRLQGMIADLRAKDPRAVIVIQSDEGPYPKQFRGKLTASHYYDPINLPLPQMKQKFGILASYYLPGVDVQTNSEPITASVNAFRFVLSHYLGYDLPPLPDCQFTAGNKFVMYDYHLVSDKLKGIPVPAECKEYQ